MGRMKASWFVGVVATMACAGSAHANCGSFTGMEAYKPPGRTQADGEAKAAAAKAAPDAPADAKRPPPAESERR